MQPGFGLFSGAGANEILPGSGMALVWKKQGGQRVSNRPAWGGARGCGNDVETVAGAILSRWSRSRRGRSGRLRLRKPELSDADCCDRFGSQAAARQSITPPAAFGCIPATQRPIFQVFALSVCFHQKRPLDRAINEGTDRLLSAAISIDRCNTFSKLLCW